MRLPRGDMAKHSERGPDRGRLHTQHACRTCPRDTCSVEVADRDSPHPPRLPSECVGERERSDTCSPPHTTCTCGAAAELQSPRSHRGLAHAPCTRRASVLCDLSPGPVAMPSGCLLHGHGTRGFPHFCTRPDDHCDAASKGCWDTRPNSSSWESADTYTRGRVTLPDLFPSTDAGTVKVKTLDFWYRRNQALCESIRSSHLQRSGSVLPPRPGGRSHFVPGTGNSSLENFPRTPDTWVSRPQPLARSGGRAPWEGES